MLHYAVQALAIDNLQWERSRHQMLLVGGCSILEQPAGRPNGAKW